jgi:uncharacterized protein YecE (DUF72 family)
VFLEPDSKRPVRHAVEFRHESFLTDRFIDLLRKHNIALVVADVASKYPTAEDVTADFVYLRLHGSRKMYQSGYTPREIKAWAKKIRAWHKGNEPADARRIAVSITSSKLQHAGLKRTSRDVFVFFDNTDVKLRAPVDARAMAVELGLESDRNIEQMLEEIGAAKRVPSKAKHRRAS